MVITTATVAVMMAIVAAMVTAAAVIPMTMTPIMVAAAAVVPMTMMPVMVPAAAVSFASAPLGLSAHRAHPGAVRAGQR